MKDARTQMRRRAELAEHPFGTLKCRAGYRHFLVRGFKGTSNNDDFFVRSIAGAGGGDFGS
jgi:hypothetical protein